LSVMCFVAGSFCNFPGVDMGSDIAPYWPGVLRWQAWVW
jgi:hypothetical protein